MIGGGVGAGVTSGSTSTLENDSPASPDVPPYDMEVEDINDSEVRLEAVQC